MNSFLFLTRQFSDVATFGTLQLFNGRCDLPSYTCQTLEPPYPKCESDMLISGSGNPIALGVYKCTVIYSQKFKCDVLLLHDVPLHRQFIEIHPGNYPKDTKGCILVGRADIYSNKHDFVSDSRDTLKNIIDYVKGSEHIFLYIRDTFTNRIVPTRPL